MISKEEIKKLAELARIEMDEKEQEKLALEMDVILEYVGQIKEVVERKEAGFASPEQGEVESGAPCGVVNVFREDENPTTSEAHSKELIAEFPKSENNYLKVKKIL